MDLLSRLQERMPTRLFRRLPGFLVGAAWFFIFFSFAHLAWVLGMKWSDPAGLTALYQTTVDGETYRAFGLAYSGAPGMGLAVFQTLILLGATVASLWRADRVRRLGHVVLTAWAGLWMLNLMRLASIDLQLDSLCQTAAMTLLFAGTGVRSLREWNHPARPWNARYTRMVLNEAFPDDPDDGELTSDHITSGPALTEITEVDHPQEDGTPAGARPRMAALGHACGCGAQAGAKVAGRVGHGLAAAGSAFIAGVRSSRSQKQRPTSA